MQLSRYNKALVALGGALAQLILLFPDSTYARVAQVLLAALTAVGVYIVPNTLAKERL